MQTGLVLCICSRDLDDCKIRLSWGLVYDETAPSTVMFRVVVTGAEAVELAVLEAAAAASQIASSPRQRIEECIVEAGRMAAEIYYFSTSPLTAKELLFNT